MNSDLIFFNSLPGVRVLGTISDALVSTVGTQKPSRWALSEVSFARTVLGRHGALPWALLVCAFLSFIHREEEQEHTLVQGPGLWPSPLCSKN